ncbi:hypothetical protein G7Y89_g11291 [Cudoniella acicularis]|uniref:Major facilitator superfamily (MFS) profile domain-containing protein n=1 Tax=Cudoniella acicularis TaxID=354080 RepID=A0A8H4W0S3_9HELO|nr:hypothetical protein G7Y89_g11291 [Cudoniella acicularis]
MAEDRVPLLGLAHAVEDLDAKAADSIPRDASSSDLDNFCANASVLLRKIDLRLLPVLFITFNFNFIDKSILSSASVFGLGDDINLVGNQYSWVSSMFYVGYFIWEYPSTVLIQKLPVGKYMAFNVVAWGFVVAATSLCSSYGELMTARFLTGALEATISPAALYITSMWYTRDELPSRMAICHAGNSAGGAVASVFSYVIGHITHPLTPWKWLYIIFGTSTTLWGLVVLLFLPDSIETAHFLDEDEKELAEQRVLTSGSQLITAAMHKWKVEQAIECLLDPKTWFCVCISLFAQIPNGGTQGFANLLLTGFGFTPLQSTLIGLPSSVISLTTILVSGRLATLHRNTSTILISTMTIPPVIGSALMNWGPNPWIKLTGYYLLGFSHGVMPLTIALVGSNFRGVTKKMTVTALMFCSFCGGNIIGPQLFHKSEAPHYPTAFKSIAISYALVSLTSLFMRFFLIRINKKRDIAERTSGLSQQPVLEDLIDEEPILLQKSDDDATDYNGSSIKPAD